MFDLNPSRRYNRHCEKSACHAALAAGCGGRRSNLSLAEIALALTRLAMTEHKSIGMWLNLARALASGARGSGFESRHSDSSFIRVPGFEEIAAPSQ